MNRSLLNRLALMELVLALLFTIVCVIVFFVQPDSLYLQLMLVLIGFAGIFNGFILVRKIKQSKTPSSRKGRSRPIPNQKAKRSSGYK